MTWGVVEGARVGLPDFHPTASPIYGTAWELRPSQCLEAAIVARNRSGFFPTSERDSIGRRHSLGRYNPHVNVRPQ
jgi:hypothetical protein